MPPVSFSGALASWAPGLVRNPGFQREFPGDVRLHGLRLLRAGDCADFLPHSQFVPSLMLTLMTFGAGFLMRPLGAIVLGSYTDHRGRRSGLILTLSLMSLGIISIACVPGYSRIGLLAPLLVLEASRPQLART